MTILKPLANRKNAVKPSDGNSQFKYKDATANVASVIIGGRPNGATKNAGCKSCGK